MKKSILLVVAVTSIYARSYNYYNCDSLYDSYKREYNNASGKSSYNEETAYQRYCFEILGKAPDKSSYSISEPEDQVRFLEIQKRTLGVACEQIQKGIEISYKHEYCDILRSFDTNVQNTPKLVENEVKQTQRKKIDPAKEYKNTPQLKMSELHIYGITNIKYFRDKKDIVMVESLTGNFALPLSVIASAERINFTSALSQKIDTLIR
jgi:hypothetical protein